MDIRAQGWEEPRGTAVSLRLSATVGPRSRSWLVRGGVCSGAARHGFWGSLSRLTVRAREKMVFL